MSKKDVAYPLGESYCHSLESHKPENTLPLIITSRIRPANLCREIKDNASQDILCRRLRSVGDEKAMLIENRINIEAMLAS